MRLGLGRPHLAGAPLPFARLTLDPIADGEAQPLLVRVRVRVRVRIRVRVRVRVGVGVRVRVSRDDDCSADTSC